MAHSIPSEDSYERQFPTLVVVSAWFGAVLILITAVGHSFSGPFEPSWARPVVEIMQFVLVALILASMFFLLLRIEDGFQVTAVPLLINIGTLVIIRLVPFGVLWEEVRFQTHFHQYQTAAAKVEAGEWQADANGVISLSPPYHRLSADNGRLWVSQTDDAPAIFFVTEQRGINRFAGYYHHPNGRPPQSGEFQGQWRTIVQKRAGWYYCLSN